jgi:hypothetical protein
MKIRFVTAAVSLALGGAGTAQAIYLNPQGEGQALIYPYYTVRSTNGNAFNTFISVMHHDGDWLANAARPSRGKVLRVKFREGRNAREVASFNLYLSPNDVWTAALIPTADGTSLITADTSCTNPAFAASAIPGLRELAFSSQQYSGANSDGGEQGLDRTREGYVEIFEMANLSGIAAAAVTHNSAGFPANCGLVQGATVNLPSISAPSGGLSGTATLINVANGMDFTANAEALDDVFSGTLYRTYTDPYPDWNASQVKRISHITANGRQYRLDWAIAVDAVSSVLTRSNVMNEYIRDSNTQSQTDWVVTFPTRRLHVNNFGTAAPFTAPLQNGIVCEEVIFSSFTRELRGASSLSCSNVGTPCGPAQLCHAATVVSLKNTDPSPTSGVLGSTNRALVPGMSSDFSNGWMDVAFIGVNARAGLPSLPWSIARSLDTGAGTTAEQRFVGLPAVGFMVRTFVNGTLGCAAGSCQGNYGGSFPHKYLQRTP